MTIAEILKAKGVSDDTIQAVQEDMKTNKIFTASEENLDIRYGKLKTDHENVTRQLGEANTLIETLKKSSQGNEESQQKITAYEQQIAQLQAELKQAQIDGAVNTALLAAGVKPEDVDYVTFKLKAKGELELGDNGQIKGIDDKIAALKTQFPNQFEGAGGKRYKDNSLPGGGGGSEITLEQFRKMGIAERSKLKEENEALYNEFKGK